MKTFLIIAGSVIGGLFTLAAVVLWRISAEIEYPIRDPDFYKN